MQISTNSLRLSFLFFLLLPYSYCFSAEQNSNSIPLPKNATNSDMGELTDGRVKEKPQIQRLANGKYQIGAITVDKANRHISIPGKMLSDEPQKAIEFIATMNNGYKSYKSVFMLDVNAYEFNLACILIGLDAAHAVPPKFHFDPEPVKGNPVSIRVNWDKNGKQVDLDVIELLKTQQSKSPKSSRWSYTGSMFVGGDQYLAQMEGVLIGVVHDPASIIEHHDGLGLGNRGFVTIDPKKAPIQGQKITLQIQGI